MIGKTEPNPASLTGQPRMVKKEHKDQVGSGGAAKCTRGGRFDHVGLILKLSDRRLAILEATS